MIPASGTWQGTFDPFASRGDRGALRDRLCSVRIAFSTGDDRSKIGHFGEMKALIVVDAVDGEAMLDLPMGNRVLLEAGLIPPTAPDSS